VEGLREKFPAPFGHGAVADAMTRQCGDIAQKWLLGVDSPNNCYNMFGGWV